jgi:hypothetical protein
MNKYISKNLYINEIEAEQFLKDKLPWPKSVSIMKDGSHYSTRTVVCTQMGPVDIQNEDYITYHPLMGFEVMRKNQFETIYKELKEGQEFVIVEIRHGRLVITEELAKKIKCPFPPEKDL